MSKVKVNKHGILVIDFRYHCIRRVLSTGLKDTKANRQLVNLKAKAMEYDAKLNRLNIKKYFPQFVDEETKEQTLADFYKFYLDEKDVRPATWTSINYAWSFIEPHFGNFNINDIGKHEILMFRKGLKKTLSATTVNTIIGRFASIINRAIEAGIYKGVTPFHKIGQLVRDTEPIDPFSFDELRALLNYLETSKPEYYDMIFVWSRCGFRHGEILALKWDDLDYHNKQITINRTLSAGKEGPPKTPNSKRTLDLSDEVIKAFKRQEKRSRMVCEHIFHNSASNQRYNSLGDFQHRFRSILKLAGLKYRNPNQMRHTFATLHIAAGENITWVSKMLGHRDVKTTLSRYNKFIPNLTRHDGSAFENAFKKDEIRKVQENE